MAFAERLRMSNIFPSGGNQPFSAPDISGDGAGLFNYLMGKITQRQDALHMQDLNEKNAQFNARSAFAPPTPQGRLGQIAQNVAAPQSPTAGMNVVFKDNTLTPYQKAQIDIDRQRLDETKNVNSRRTATADDNASTKAELAALKIKNENLTASEKAAQKAVTDRELLETKNAAAEKALTTKGDQNKELEAIKNNNRVQLQGMREGDVGTIEIDGKPVSVWYNPGTKTLERVKLDNEDIGPITKPGTPGKSSANTVDPVAARERVKTMTQQTLDSLNDLFDSKTGKLASDVSTSVGMSRYLDPRNYIAGTSAQTGDRKFDNFLSKQVLGVIGEMKAQSKTGATGFGALNLKELEVLEKAANALSKNMPDEDIEKELNTIRPQLEKILKDTPEDGGEMVKTQRNSKGQTREVVSTDGGKTWHPR